MEQEKVLKDKYPQGDLFICEISDAVIKGIMPQLEHPFYSPSKNPVMTFRCYEYGKSWAEVHPSYKGMATLYDKDILIYAISQIKEKINRGEEITSRIVKINTPDLVMLCNRGTSGKDDRPSIRTNKTYEIAKGLLSDDVDVYDIEQQWFDWWLRRGCRELSKPDRTFLGFVITKFLIEEE